MGYWGSLMCIVIVTLVTPRRGARAKGHAGAGGPGGGGTEASAAASCASKSGAGAGAGAPGVRAFAGSWTKPAESIDAALFRDCASSALFRRVAEMTNFDFSSNTRLPTSRTCAAKSQENPFYEANG
jgi:hypothetical protein